MPVHWFQTWMPAAAALATVLPVTVVWRLLRILTATPATSCTTLPEIVTRWGGGPSDDTATPVPVPGEPTRALPDTVTSVAPSSTTIPPHPTLFRDQSLTTLPATTTAWHVPPWAEVAHT